MIEEEHLKELRELLTFCESGRVRFITLAYIHVDEKSSTGESIVTQALGTALPDEAVAVGEYISDFIYKVNDKKHAERNFQ